MYLWLAVNDEGEVLDLVVQRGPDTEAALRLLRRLQHNQRVEPQMITTDGLVSYGAALDQPDLRHLHRPGRLATTIGQRTSTFRSGDENGSSSGSNPKPQPRDFSLLMWRSTTRSTPAAFDQQTDPSAFPRRGRHFMVGRGRLISAG